MSAEHEVHKPNAAPQALTAPDGSPVERKVYTPQQLADERWQCSYELILDHIQTRRLKAFNVGKGRRPTWRIPLSAIVAFEQGLPMGCRQRGRARSRALVRRY